jgi:hypothetical protein
VCGAVQVVGPRCPPFAAAEGLDRLSNERSAIVDRVEVAAGAFSGHTVAMTIPAPISRLTLIPEPRAETPGATVVRRYHLSRLRLNGRAASQGRHGHLKRTYD